MANRRVLAVVMAGTFMGGLDTYVVNVALPTIAWAFDTGVAVVQWVSLAYLVAITSTLVICGRASDLWGSRRVYVGGLLTFTAGSALAGAAPDAWSLVAFRALQGLGAAMLLASGQALLAEVFPEKQRGRAMAFMHIAVALGFTSGPFVGGLLVEAVGWRWVFYVNVPIGLLAAVLAARALTSTRRDYRPGFHLMGACTLVAGLVLVLVAVTRVQQGAWEGAWAPLFLGLAMLTGFLLIERSAPNAILDLQLFGRRAFTAGLVATFLNFIAMASNMFLVPFLLQLQFGMSPWHAGLLMMTVPVTILWAAPLGGWLSDRFGPRGPATAGLGAVTASVFAMAVAAGGASLYVFAAVLVLYGLGAGLFQSPNNSGVLGAVPTDRLGAASGTLATLRQLGQVAGITVASTAWVTREQAYQAAGLAGPAAQAAGFRDAFLVLAAAGLLAITASALRGGREASLKEGGESATAALDLPATGKLRMLNGGPSK